MPTSEELYELSFLDPKWAFNCNDDFTANDCTPSEQGCKIWKHLLFLRECFDCLVITSRWDWGRLKRSSKRRFSLAQFLLLRKTLKAPSVVWFQTVPLLSEASRKQENEGGRDRDWAREEEKWCVTGVIHRPDGKDSHCNQVNTG